ncbi:MAG: alkaline phosphatase family protein, partial [SAR202 cluster bacterium]|nr:alkaline phosphatase family protein [SAR202 cluster bacterium]
MTVGSVDTRNEPLEVLRMSPDKKKVLIIGIDGCRPDALLAAETPNLDTLIDDGLVSYQAQTCEFTVSAPGWSSMLTGVWPNKHGVKDTSFDGADYGSYPHFFQRLKEAREDAVTASIVNW